MYYAVTKVMRERHRGVFIHLSNCFRLSGNYGVYHSRLREEKTRRTGVRPLPGASNVQR